MAQKARLWWAGAVVLLLVLLAVALVVPRLIDVETYRAHVERALREATGWEPELGRMDLSLFNGLVLTVTPAQLVAPENSSRMSVEHIEVRAALRPLLAGKLDIRGIKLVGPDVHLVRPGPAREWVLPGSATSETSGTTEPPSRPERKPSLPDGRASGSEAGLEVAVGAIAVERGKLLFDDRSVDPPLRFELNEVRLDFAPRTGRIDGEALIGGAGGRLEWRGSVREALTLTIDALPTAVLEPWLGPDLVHSGGKLSGQLEMRWPSQATGRLDGTGLTMLAGEEPFDTCRVEFTLANRGPEWRLERLDFTGDGARIEGSGALLPVLALELKLPATPLDVLLDASASVLPLPLDVSSPGQATATIRVDQPAGGALTYTAEGTLSAAALRLGAPVPEARDIRATFDLSRAGVLTVRVAEGQVSGGKLSGVATLDRVDPPGKLVFDGRIDDAGLGALLAGFVGDAAGRVSGPTGLAARVGVDLSRGEFDARALSGRLELAAQQVAMPGWDAEAAIRTRLGEKLGVKTTDEAVEAGVEKVRELLDGMQVAVDFDSWPWKLENLSLSAGGIALVGGGSFDPLLGNVDLRLASTMSLEKTRKLIAEHSELKYAVDGSGRLAIPLELKGPMLSPRFDVELDDLLSRALDNRKDDAVKGAVRGLLDRLNKKQK